MIHPQLPNTHTHPSPLAVSHPILTQLSTPVTHLTPFRVIWTVTVCCFNVLIDSSSKPCEATSCSYQASANTHYCPELFTPHFCLYSWLSGITVTPKPLHGDVTTRCNVTAESMEGRVVTGGETG